MAAPETWLSSSTTKADVKIFCYKIHRLDRNHKRGGGLCICTRNNFKVKTSKDLSYISSSDFHQQWLQIQVKQHKSMIVCVSYKPPDCSVTCFSDDLKLNYTEALLLGKNIVIKGDLNCDLINPNCPKAKLLTDTCSELQLIQLIDAPTRITLQSRSLLDVTLVTSSLMLKGSGVTDFSVSGHSVIYCRLRLSATKPPPQYIYTRSYKHYIPSHIFLNYHYSPSIKDFPWKI